MKISKKFEEKQINFCRKKIPHIYLYIIVIMILIGICNELFRSDYTTYYGLDEFQNVTNQWKDANGNEFDFENMDQYYINSKNTVSVYMRCPYYYNDQTIVFRSINASVEVYCDNEMVYETAMVKAPFYNKSPGMRWNMIKLPEKVSGKQLEIRITRYYKSLSCKIDRIYIGDRAAIVLNIIKQKSIAVFICVLIFFIGLIYLGAAIILNNNHVMKDFSLLYLGVFAVFSSMWCLLETNVIQLFSNNLPQIQVMDDMTVMLSSIPVFLYVDCVYLVFKLRTVRYMFYFNMLYVLISVVFHILGVQDLHQTLGFSYFLYGYIMLVLIICIIRQEIIFRKIKRRTIHDFLQEAGILIFGITIVTDCFRSLMIDVMDRALFSRVGLFIFVICFGAGNIYRLTQLVNQGVKMELIGKMAYMDGLTECGNRTAYMEKLDELAKEGEAISVLFVVFDVNNLKLTNDNLGHHVGDQLIKKSAKLIKITFGRFGEVYRVGGDEFTVLCINSLMLDSYHEIEAEFQEKIMECNQSQKYPFVIKIAFGAACCDVVNKKNLQYAEKMADDKMYYVKNELKKNPDKGIKDSMYMNHDLEQSQ